MKEPTAEHKGKGRKVEALSGTVMVMIVVAMVMMMVAVITMMVMMETRMVLRMV